MSCVFFGSFILYRERDKPAQLAVKVHSVGIGKTCMDKLRNPVRCHFHDNAPKCNLVHRLFVKKHREKARCRPFLVCEIQRIAHLYNLFWRVRVVAQINYLVWSEPVDFPVPCVL